MHWFLKLVFLLPGLFFAFIGGELVFNSKRIIQAIQQRKYGRIVEPRKPEILVAKILGLLFGLFGIGYVALAIIALL